MYWASDVEPRESGSSVIRAETPKMYTGGVRREAHAVGRWAGKTKRALAHRTRLPRHDRGRVSCGGGSWGVGEAVSDPVCAERSEQHRVESLLQVPGARSL